MGIEDLYIGENTGFLGILEASTNEESLPSLQATATLRWETLWGIDSLYSLI